MKSTRMFEFTVNKADSSIHVVREFAADLDLVWEAWTNPEIIDQWWAPKPYHTETKVLDFREGGMWLYAMVSPQDEKQWCKADYLKIEPQKLIGWLDAFCDENGHETHDKPRSEWTTAFTEHNGATTVNVTIKQERLEDVEALINMGMKEGFTTALENLDLYIETQFRLRQRNKTENRARVCSYLNFDGKTEEAFLFYQTVFKTAFIGKGIERFGNIPPSAGHPPVADEIKNMVLHVELPITGNHILMGTDAPKEMGFTLTKGNNMHICIEPESREEAERLFNELSEGGTITMPLQDMFFGAYFGEFSDQFGINWMISHQNRS